MNTAVPGPVPQRRRVVVIWLATVVALALGAVVALQHAIWMRPLIQHYVRSHANRGITFDSLRIGVDESLQPHIRFGALQIENAGWAAGSRLLIDARRFEFTITWASVFGARRIVLPSMLIEDADIDLERRSDGLRNWRLAQPDDRGSGRVRVGVLDAQRTRLRLVHQAIGLQLAVESAPLQTPHALAGHPEMLLARQLTFNGRRQGQAFAGQASASARLSLLDSDVRCGFGGGVLQTAAARLQVDGTVRNLLALDDLDAQLQLTGRQPGQVAAVLTGAAAEDLAWPALPTQASAHLHKQAQTWELTDLQAVVGSSDVAGRVALTQRQGAAHAPSVQAALASRHIRLDDWAALFAGPPGGSPASQRAAPSRPLFGRLDALVADVDLTVAALDGVSAAADAALALTAVHVHARLDGGQLQLQPVAFKVLGGHIAASALVDGSRTPAHTALDVRATGLRLDAITAFAGAKALQSLAGALDAQAALQLHGDTLATLAAGTSGDVEAHLRQASVAPRLDAALALDGGAWVRALFAGSRDAVPIDCGQAAMHFEGGRGRSRRLVIDTERVQLRGSASVDLGQRSFDVLLTPHRKHPALFALDKSMQWRGGTAGARLTLVDVAEVPAPRQPGAGADSCAR